MSITGKITGIKYKIHFADELQQIDFTEFDVNEAPSS
jgi:hypothetical protein